MRFRRMLPDQLNLFQNRPVRVTWKEIPEKVQQETKQLLTRLFTQYLHDREQSGAGKEASDER